MVREFLKNHKWLQEDMDMKRFAALIASAALVLSGYSSNVQVFAAAADSETDENIWETVEDAYVYAFPLVLMDSEADLRQSFLEVHSFPDCRIRRLRHQ